jgi:hypothetical protein
MYSEAVRGGMVPPIWTTVVNAIVIRNSTSVSMRELIAGRAQKASQNVKKCVFTDLTRLFRRELERNDLLLDAGQQTPSMSELWKTAFEKAAWQDEASPNLFKDVCSHHITSHRITSNCEVECVAIGPRSCAPPLFVSIL